LKLISRRGFRNLNSRRSRNRAPRRVFYKRQFSSNAFVRRKLNYNFSSGIQTMGPVRNVINITTTTEGNFNALNYANNNNLYGFEEFLQKADDFSLFKIDYIHVTVYPNQKANTPTIASPLYVAMDWFGDRNYNFIYSDNVKIVTPSKVNVKHFTFRPVNTIINGVNLRDWTPIGVTIPGRLMLYSEQQNQDIWRVRIEYRVKFAYAKDHTPNQLKLEKMEFSIMSQESIPEEEKLEGDSDEEEESKIVSKSFKSEIKEITSQLEDIKEDRKKSNISVLQDHTDRVIEEFKLNRRLEELKKERRKRRNQNKKKRREKEEYLKDKLALKNIKKENEWNKEKYIKNLQQEIENLKKRNQWLEIEYDLYHKRKDKNDKYKNYLDKKAEDLKAERKIIDEYHANRGRTMLTDEDYRYNLMQQHFKENRRRKRQGKSPLKERMVDIALKNRPTFGNDCSGYGINPIV